jgi:hypothetical protein
LECVLCAHPPPPTVAASQSNRVPLMYACKYGRLSHVQLLLAHGADATLRDEYRRTILMYAVERCNVDIARMLLDHGSVVNDSDEVRVGGPARCPALGVPHLRLERRGQAGSEGGSNSSRVVVVVVVTFAVAGGRNGPNYCVQAAVLSHRGAAVPAGRGRATARGAHRERKPQRGHPGHVCEWSARVCPPPHPKRLLLQ